MAAERGSGPNGVLALRKVTLGDAATASFVLCVVSGVFLAAPFDANDAPRSIAGWLLANPAAVFLRNLHYWTAQLFLVLTALHIWDHLRTATERKVGRGVWLRLVLSVPVIAFLMLSGFLLRGDADAQQAHRILEEVVTRIPLAGPLLATLFFGAGDGLQVVYVQHAATATIIVWLVIIEHARRLWPRAGAVAALAAAAGTVSLVLSPGLHDGMHPAVKGPWYFLGLQEILHWTPWPLVVVGAGGIVLVVLWVIPRLPAAWSARAKGALLVGACAYALLCGVGLFLRAENWSFRPNWPGGPADLRAGRIFGTTSLHADQIPAALPVVLGRTEGCLVCHAEITGLGDAHRPESIGCASCHGGDRFTLDKDRAHAAMVAVPGNLADAARTCGQAGCHETIVPRIERSIMTTFAGVIDVNRRVFGEAAAPTNHPPHVRDLGHTPADSHLRQLCASCHLGQEKIAWGPITQESRGGGCNACHLSYSGEAAAELARYEATPLGARTAIPRVHPALSIAADDGHCFGCHSRSGRISTNYEGWHELHEAPTPAALAAEDPATPRFRQLDDGRYFVRMQPDIHQERGLTCIDCHTANEVMGTGAIVARKSEQVRVRCEDCHASALASVPATGLDPESRKILAVRKWTGNPSQRFGVAAKGDALLNVAIDSNGTGRLRRKRTGELANLRAPLPVCTEGAGHDRLTCNACHSAWAPRCTTCHTSFDPAEAGFDHLAQSETQGAWIESSGGFQAMPPTLGVRSDPGDATHPSGVVDTFVPGMILTIYRNREAGKPPDPISRRLYARTFAHTIRREARSCESCHNDPVALGFGRGELRFEVAAATPTHEATGRWRFAAAEPPSADDGLPADAWTGFLQARAGMMSTRDDVRPFTVDEQRRILRAGACLTCHPGDSLVMKQSVADFEALLARRSARCAVPDWE
jgi:hypothetical protein